MKFINLIIVFLSAIVIYGCETVNSTTVKDMPTGYLCDILGPQWTTLPSERKAIYKELELRNARCISNSIGIQHLN